MGARCAAAEALRACWSSRRAAWIQLGAFRQRDAPRAQRRVADELDSSRRAWRYSSTPLFRLQAGPYASREEAREGAERVRDALQLVPLIVERR